MPVRMTDDLGEGLLRGLGQTTPGQLYNSDDRLETTLGLLTPGSDEWLMSHRAMFDPAGFFTKRHVYVEGEGYMPEAQAEESMGKTALEKLKRKKRQGYAYGGQFGSPGKGGSMGAGMGGYQPQQASPGKGGMAQPTQFNNQMGQQQNLMNQNLSMGYDNFLGAQQQDAGSGANLASQGREYVGPERTPEEIAASKAQAMPTLAGKLESAGQGMNENTYAPSLNMQVQKQPGTPGMTMTTGQEVFQPGGKFYNPSNSFQSQIGGFNSQPRPPAYGSPGKGGGGFMGGTSTGQRSPITGNLPGAMPYRPPGGGKGGGFTGSPAYRPRPSRGYPGRGSAFGGKGG